MAQENLLQHFNWKKSGTCWHLTLYTLDTTEKDADVTESQRHATVHPDAQGQMSSEYDLAMDLGLALSTSSSVILIILHIVQDVKADAAKNVFKPVGNIVHRAVSHVHPEKPLQQLPSTTNFACINIG